MIQDFAEQDDFVQPGSQLIQLEDRSKVEVRFSLRMDQMRWLWNSVDDVARAVDKACEDYTYELPQVPVSVRVESDGNHFIWPARLDRYDGAGIDSRTRTVPLIAVVEDPGNVSIQRDKKALPLGRPPTLLRGSYVTVDLPVGQNMSLVSVPAHAYRPDKTVWIYNNGDTFDRNRQGCLFRRRRSDRVGGRQFDQTRGPGDHQSASGGRGKHESADRGNITTATWTQKRNRRIRAAG